MALKAVRRGPAAKTAPGRVEPKRCEGGSPETRRSSAVRDLDSDRFGKVASWPAAGGHERLLRRCETREAEAERWSALEKPDGREWVGTTCSRPREAAADGPRYLTAEPLPPNGRFEMLTSRPSIDSLSGCFSGPLPFTVQGRTSLTSLIQSSGRCDRPSAYGRVGEFIRIPGS